MKKLIFLLLLLFSPQIYAQNVSVSDRQAWVDFVYKLSLPILSNMSEGRLKQSMVVKKPPHGDSRPKDVAYMEAFGRLMAGIAPWLNLPDDDTQEGIIRKQVRSWALKSYVNAVDPKNPDYLNWTHRQALVDGSYIAESFLRAPERLWNPLDKTTKERYIKHFKQLRKIPAYNNNWHLFPAMVETFLLSVDPNEHDMKLIKSGIKKINGWYVGDGFYSDGPKFEISYYNSYVMHPMYVEIMAVLSEKGLEPKSKYETALKRMQRYSEVTERLISPECTYPPLGRSSTYRMAIFQPLAWLAWKEKLPADLSNGQVRNALTCVMNRMFQNNTYDTNGYLQIGFVGQQPEMADYYTNNGSLYITSTFLLPLGLPADAPFWTDPAQDWTNKKAWGGVSFPRDIHKH